MNEVTYSLGGAELAFFAAAAAAGRPVKWGEPTTSYCYTTNMSLVFSHSPSPLPSLNLTPGGAVVPIGQQGPAVCVDD